MTAPVPQQVSLRRARPGDLPALMAIETRAFAHPWSEDMLARELDHDWSTVLVAEGPGGAPVGFAIFWTIQDEIHLLDVAVDPDHRRQGVATALLRGLVDGARARQAARVLLEVRRSNAGAQALYRGQGFAATGVRPRYYVPDREDAVLMELAL